MSRHSGNRAVVEALQNALTDFLEDQRTFAHSDPEWLKDFESWTQKERDEIPGCGCEDCTIAGKLRDSNPRIHFGIARF